MTDSIVGIGDSARAVSAGSFSGKRRQRYCSVTGLRDVVILISALLLGIACHRKTRSESFVDSLRCGMTRQDVTRLAKETGYSNSDASWLARSTGKPSMKAKELSLIDLTFRTNRLVSVREGVWNPVTRRVTYRTRDLCAR